MCVLVCVCSFYIKELIWIKEARLLQNFTGPKVDLNTCLHVFINCIFSER